MKKRFNEAQIIGFLQEADAGLPVKQLCRTHGFSEASFYLRRSKLQRAERVGREAPEGGEHRECTAEEAVGGVPPHSVAARRRSRGAVRPDPPGLGLRRRRREVDPIRWTARQPN